MSLVARLRQAVGSVALTGRGIGFLATAAVTFVAAPLLSLPALQQVTALLLGLVVCSALFVTVGHSRVRIERTFAPEVVATGGTTTATVHVTNLSGLPCPESAWRDTVPAGVSAEASGVLPALGAARSRRSQVRFTYELQGLRRGRHPIGPLRVQVQDPFGLVLRRHSFGATQDLVVLPRRVELFPLSPHGADNDGASRPAPQHAGIGEDDVIARSYLPGDALKRMHWKATAHRGQLMVRQEEQQVNPRAGVVIDRDARSFGTDRDGRGSWDHSPAFEWAVMAAASVVSHLSRVGYAVVARAPGGAVERRLSAGEDALQDVLVDLALIEPSARAGVAVDEVTTGERTTFVVLGRPDAERAREWVEALADSSTVLALVQLGTGDEALDVLSSARWRTSMYRPDDDVAELWSVLDGSRNRAAS